MSAVHAASPSRAVLARLRWPRFARTKSGAVGLAMVTFVLFVAIVGPLLAPDPPDAPIGPPGHGPVAAAPLGTDYLGRDVFSRLLHGGLSLITVTVVAVVLTYTVGIALGLTAGFLRGWVDSALMRTVDLLMAFPPLLLLLVLIVGAGSSDLTVVIGIVAVLAAPLSRLVYSATLQASATGYVEAARVRGERTRGILVREILPNIVPYILASFGAYVSGAVIFVASLSFLGVGAQPPAADWGLMITENQPVLASNPLALLAPAAMIGLITVGINLIGDAYARTAGVSEGVT
jgi:ABC-type dipeptide/oligopeptide/nickel transport system permease subunit